MKTTTFKPEKFLRPTHRKQEIAAEVIQDFKQKLNIFLANIHEPSREGKQETDLRDFLNDALYKGKFYINKKETIDWAIHNGMDAKSKVAVLIEVKKTAEKTDMFTEAKPNVKAFHELVLYYLRERIDNNNHEIKHLIATNCHEWYIFNELWFNENIFTTQLKKTYQEWKLSGHGTDDFYKFHAKTYLETLEKPLEFCRIDVRDYVKASDKKVSELYKILSPEHLLKQEIANDANKLNKPFYNELLYLIGIEERKDEKSNKKIIERLLPAHRKEGSLLENTIEQLETKNALSKVQNLEAFGDTEEEQKYSVALELCITWLNRLLFLKLLEGQLIKYHGGDRKYRFLTSDRINDFDELGELFFGVLAKRPEDRRPSVQQKFGDIPYLNSSLFEESNLENNVLSVELLKDRLELPLFGSTVLKDSNGKTRKGEVKTLKYLLDFLDSYDFGSKDAKEVAATKDSNAINHDRTINAAVLGLIFEKLNGYKDGSFFTPSFITMYMCRETLRRSVVQKFNDTQNWNCQDFTELHEHLDDDYKKPEKRKAYNDLLNSIRICDPAVGSGHFLVSALNEMIAIKAELKILQHPNGSRLKGYEISVENDELIVWDEETQKDFQYKIGQGGKPIQELQLVQETLFHEKRTIIENCLFGVDINPKSVSICQLRLWIELLKNAFYTPESKYLYLETLPNIDINIKTGNSLVSKYSLTEDLSEVFKKNKFSVDAYRTSVHAYKEANTKTAKAELQKFINEIKEQFKETVRNTDPRRKKLSEFRGKRSLLDLNVDMFGNKSLSDSQLVIQKRKFDKQIKELEDELLDVSNLKLYRNSFEWRFEFPEVLDENGDFVGFDVVVGNPPYGIKFEDNYKEFFKKTYSDIHVRTPESFNYFIKQFSDISNKSGLCNFIIPSSFLNQIEFEKTRELILKLHTPYDILNLGDNIFEDVATPTCIIGFSKKHTKDETKYADLSSVERKELEQSMNNISNLVETKALLENQSFSFIFRKHKSILDRCYNNIPTLKDISEDVATGISSGLDKAYVFEPEDIQEKELEISLLKKLVVGGEIHRYHINPILGKQIIYITDDRDIDSFPNIKKELLRYKDQLSKRREAANGKIQWYSLNWPRRQKLFDEPKILIRQTANKIMAAYDADKWYCLKSGIIIQLPISSKYSYGFLVGLLNSTLMDFLYHDLVNEDNRIFPEVKPIQLFKLPIKQISEIDQAPFIEIVNQIVALKKEDSQSDTSELEAEIDRMVYELYELTEEEILIVEGK